VCAGASTNRVRASRSFGATNLRTTLAEGFIEHDGTGGGDVERADAARHWNAQQVVAGAANQLVQARAFAAQHQHAVAGQVELVVVGSASFVQADDPHILLFQVFQGTDQVDDAGNAEVFGCSSAGLDGDRADGRGAALGEDNAVHASAVGYAEQRAQVLRVFHAVEGQQQAAARRISCVRRVQILYGEEFLRANESDDALVIEAVYSLFL